MEVSIFDYYTLIDQELYPLVKQSEFANIKKVSRATVRKSIINGKLDFVKIDTWSINYDEPRFTRYIIYNERAKRLTYKRRTYGLTEEELNKK